MFLEGLPLHTLCAHHTNMVGHLQDQRRELGQQIVAADGRDALNTEPRALTLIFCTTVFHSLAVQEGRSFSLASAVLALLSAAVCAGAPWLIFTRDSRALMQAAHADAAAFDILQACSACWHLRPVPAQDSGSRILIQPESCCHRPRACAANVSVGASSKDSVRASGSTAHLKQLPSKIADEDQGNAQRQTIRLYDV